MALTGAPLGSAARTAAGLQQGQSCSGRTAWQGPAALGAGMAAAGSAVLEQTEWGTQAGLAVAEQMPVAAVAAQMLVAAGRTQEPAAAAAETAVRQEILVAAEQKLAAAVEALPAVRRRLAAALGILVAEDSAAAGPALQSLQGKLPHSETPADCLAASIAAAPGSGQQAR